MALVYIAGPYSSGDQVLNTRRAMEAGLLVHERTGAGVIVPHLTLIGHAMFPRQVDYWYEFDLAQVTHCTHLVRLAGESTGADREVAYAEERGIPVFYDVDEVITDLTPATPWAGA
jgi:hypothetical protein